MRYPVGFPVPSKNVLRYLRARSDNYSNFVGCDTAYCINVKSKSTSSSSSSSSLSSSSSSSSSLRATRVGRYQRRCLGTVSTRSEPPKHYYNKDDNKLSKQHEPLKALPAPRSSLYTTYNRHSSTRIPRPQKNNGWFSFWSRMRRNAFIERGRRKCEDNSRQDDTSAQLFNLSRALARSNTAASDLKLRCTEFDSNGSVTLVSGEFKKSELIAKYGLQPRDLRKIDSSVLPHILVRPSAILINLLHLRVLIQSDRVLVFDAYGSTDSYTQSLFMYDLEGKLRQKADPRNTSTYLPYEFRALEAVLISVTSGLEAEFALVRDPVTHILTELEEDIDREKLRHLLIHSKKLGTFEQKARLVRDAINDLLEADDDLAAMYLTERKNIGKPRNENDHQEVEMLLESYHKICDEIVEISGNLISNIRNTEEVVKAILDANRNQLMLLEIKFSIGTLGLAGGTLIAGLYGMNLNSFIEESDWGFGAVTAVSFVLSGMICVYGMRKLRKVQKVRMWGEGVDAFGPAVGRGNWRNEIMESHARNMRLLQDTLKAQQQAQAQGHTQYPGGASGPVLWPGMEGLGMHKLNSSSTDPTTTSTTTTGGGQVDEETGHGYSQQHSSYLTTNTNHKIMDPFDFRVSDDIENAEERMRQDRNKEKGVTIRKS